MALESPNVVMLAGPNGAGKSTAAADLLKGELRVLGVCECRHNRKRTERIRSEYCIDRRRPADARPPARVGSTAVGFRVRNHSRQPHLRTLDQPSDCGRIRVPIGVLVAPKPGAVPGEGRRKGAVGGTFRSSRRCQAAVRVGAAKLLSTVPAVGNLLAFLRQHQAAGSVGRKRWAYHHRLLAGSMAYTGSEILT